tara:strand:+ start:1000 stop:1569 length:570 start_codon:yes stop_codon:yes gene_type:complete
VLEITNHQFKYSEFYLPTWQLDYLFIGTFNPEFGEKVSYYYGRKTNYFWKIISEIFKIKIDVNNEMFFKQLKSLKIGCIDLVDCVTYDKDKYHDIINGKGYSDQVLFKNKYDIKKTYNTQIIINLIKRNNLSKVYLTNLGNVFREEQKKELKLIENFCGIINLSSPSQYNVHRKSIYQVINNWKERLKI